MTAFRRPRRHLGVVAGAVLALSGLTACGSDSADGTITLNYYGDAANLGMEDVMQRCSDASEGRYRIVGNLLPSDADGQREQLVRRLAAQSDGIDILGPDVTWTAEFAEAGWILPVEGEIAEQATDGVLQPPIDTATWEDTLYAIPKSTNVQLLWYRKSLAPEPPETWDEMFEMAQRLKDEGKPYEIGLTAAQYEGYVVAFNTLLKSNEGEVINEDSTEVVLGEPAVEALGVLKKLATSDLASRSLSNSQEPEVFAQFQAGDSAFSLNWPYVLPAMREAAKTDEQSKEVLEDLAATSYPSVIPGEPAAVTLGGRNLAVSTYSTHPDESFEAALCMASAENQVAQAQAAGDVPVLEELFEDPDVQEAFPQYEIILEELQVASSRPISPVYQNISTVISNTLSPPRSIDPEADEAELASSIQDALDGKGILP